MGPSTRYGRDAGQEPRGALRGALGARRGGAGAAAAVSGASEPGRDGGGGAGWGCRGVAGP